MSIVTFVPKDETDYFDGWPVNVVGDGFINLELIDWSIDDGENDCAMYEDQFGDEYRFEGVLESSWDVDVREDGV